ncbi:MAG: hypothetical protein ABII09_09060 [Planctomycetota bacterium]
MQFKKRPHNKNKTKKRDRWATGDSNFFTNAFINNKEISMAFPNYTAFRKHMKSNLFITFVTVNLLTGCAGPISERHYQEPQDKQPSYSSDDRNILIKMAEKKFGKLTEADKILFSAVADGNWADYREGGDKDKIENANNWGERRIINANRFEWLCRDKQAKELVTDRGIMVTGAKIEGPVNLIFAEIPFPLIFGRCVIPDKIILNSSRIKFLFLAGSRTGSIQADGVNIEGDVYLSDGFKADGEVRFIGAEISGDFVCKNGEFINKGRMAITADRMNVKGSVFLGDGFNAHGMVCFRGATIGNTFDCGDGEFVNEDGTAIVADRINVKGSVFLGDGFKADGEVRFQGAEIGGGFISENGEFNNKGGTAISADGINVKGGVFLINGFKADGEVRFLEAEIDGQFACENGMFINKGGKAISADGMNVKGGVFLRKDFKSEGEVRFLGAAISGNFDCGNGDFNNTGNIAIFADGMDIKGSVFLKKGFKANGEICFIGVAIGGNFECDRSEFVDKDGTAIRAERMNVKGSVFLRDDFNVEGRVSLIGTTISGRFTWSDINRPEKATLDLRNATVGVLCDDEKSWPERGNLFLDGFVYENIGDDAPKDAKHRIDWLNRQGEERFRPGSFEQLAKVLEKMGYNEDAIKIRIEKEKTITRQGGFNLVTKIWRFILEIFIGYGYQLWKAWIAAIFIIFVGSVVFKLGHKKIVQTDKEPYHRFNSFIYSLEKFVPVVNLSMAQYWIPDTNKRWGRFVRGYLWFHICAGWIITTLLIVGLTGLIK